MFKNLVLIAGLAIIAIAFVACAPAPTATPVPPTAVPATAVPTKAPEATKPPAPTAVPPTVAPTAVPATNTPAAPKPADANTLLALKVATAPKLDALADDAAWKTAPEMKIAAAGGQNFKGGATSATMKAVYVNDTVYFLLQYDDPTLSVQRSPFVKQADGSWKKLVDPDDKGGDNNKYYEDKFSMIWPISTIPNFDKQGCFVSCHAGEPGKPYGNKYLAEGLTADIWHWKAQRNVGQVDDQYLDSTKYDKEKSPEAGRKSDPNDGGGYKNNIDANTKLPAFGLAGNKPAGAGNYIILDDVKVPFDATKYKEGDMVPGIYAAPYKGDRGDISAAWKWADGKWTIEFGRKLDTGSKTDVQFKDLKATYYFGVAIFDNAQVRHAFQSGSTPFVFKP